MDEPDPLPLSALQHWAYCPRQCALIHLDQAEAMTGRAVPQGALFYATSKRRRVVDITPALRAEVATVASAVRSTIDVGTLPPPLQGDAARQRCHGCSLRDRCQPAAASPEVAQRLAGLFDPDRW